MPEASLPPPSGRFATTLWPPALFGLLIVVPWLWPWAPGPSVHAVPLMASGACMAAAGTLWLLSGRVRGTLAPTAAGAWLAAAAASSVIALLQWFGWADGLPGVPPSRLGEAYANLRQRNLFASLTSIGLVAALWLHARIGAAGRPAALFHAMGLLLGLGCAASLSRTGALQWWLICGIAWMRPGSRRLAGVALGSYLAALAVLPWALSALQGMDAPSLLGRLQDGPACGSRRVLWSNVLHLISLKPWLGWGLGELDYAHYATLYPGARFCDILDNAHNLPLHLAVETGLPLALAACGLLAGWVWRRRPWREREPARVLAWGVLGVIALHSLLEYPLWYGPFQFATLLALVLLGRPEAAGAQTPPQARVVALVLAAGMAAGLAWAGAAYGRVSQAYLTPEARRPAYRADPLRDVRPGPFGGHAAFARLSLTPLGRASAVQVYGLALRLLHFSPEPKVIEAAIESAVLLGQDEEAMWHLARYRAAFPAEHAAWARRNAAPMPQRP